LEGSKISIGRGTQFPFQVYGHPGFDDSLFVFTPESIPGMDNNPMYKSQKCFGLDLREIKAPEFTLKYLINAYQRFEDKDNFFRDYFHLLSGNTQLMQQIKEGLTEQEIVSSWSSDLDQYQQIRKMYLLYPDAAP
jgi:uncharacterized protein YbbC (DUF1343 family)